MSAEYEALFAHVDMTVEPEVGDSKGWLLLLAARYSEAWWAWSAHHGCRACRPVGDCRAAYDCCPTARRLLNNRYTAWDDLHSAAILIRPADDPTMLPFDMTRPLVRTSTHVGLPPAGIEAG